MVINEIVKPESRTRHSDKRTRQRVKRLGKKGTRRTVRCGHEKILL